MKTDDLIHALTADVATPSIPTARLALIALATALAFALAVLLLGVHLRADIGDAIYLPRFLLKFVETLALAVPALALVLRLTRPDASGAGLARWLVAAPAVLALAVTSELLIVPRAEWMPRLVGENAIYCLALIPLLSAAPLAGLLVVLAHGAPANPARAGFVAGLAAAAIGGTFYAGHCPDDSPLFVATWYTLASLIVSAAGALFGSRLLRW